MEFWLMDLLLHFWKHWRYQHMKTWSWVRQGILMGTRSDFILRTDQCCFRMVGIRGVSNYPSYHLILGARLLCQTEAAHYCNTGGLPSQMGMVHRGIQENRS